MSRALRGARDSRAERAVERAADPQNLIWVMPAEEGVSNEIVVVVAGGPAPAPEAALAVPAGATVVAADRGLAHAWALGLEVTFLVGDLDSVSPDDLARARSQGIPVERHPREKDATDLELALDAALAMGAHRVLLVAGDGGRLDHLLSTLLLLGAEKYAGVELDAMIGTARVHVVRGARVLGGASGELVTLLALHGPADGVRTKGLVYPLAGETLEPGSSRGVSNVFAAERVEISVERGVLLALRPGSEEAA
jgi:thiamine pyrophosphokinase